TNLRAVIFLQFAPDAARSEVWRGLRGGATLQSNCGKIVVAVSDDIDPASMDAILWSLAYRTDPVEDVQIMPNRGGVQGAQYGPRKADSGLLIDATRKRPMPPLALPAREFMAHARTLGEGLALPPLTGKAPGPGPTLGEWPDAWSEFARRAAAGDWERNGIETFSRQQGGLEPETPVRPGEPPMED